MGRYHYRMVGMDEMPTNRANDAVYKERASTQGLDYGSISFGDSLENNVAAPGEWLLYWRLCTANRSSVRRPPKP